MRFAALAGLLALVPILGIAYIVLSGSLFTVDGLFMIIILLTISGVFGLGAMLELRGMKMATAEGTAVAVMLPGAAQPTVVEKGTVLDLQFFESSVGMPNKTIVEFKPDGAKDSRLVTFVGNVRDQLPVGSRVKLNYRNDPEGNVLLSRDFVRF